MLFKGKGKKLCFGLLLVFCTIFGALFAGFSDVNATNYNSWLNIQDISKTNLSNDWITHNSNNAGSYSVSGSTTLSTYRLSASAYLPSQVSGAYFTASGDVFIDIPSNLEGGVICDSINDAMIVPEYVSYNTTTSNLTSCTMSVPNIYMHRYTLHIETTGSVPSQGTFTSFFWSIGNSSNQTIIDLIGTPSDSPRVFLSGNINITIGSTPELEGLGVINQNITIISNELHEYYEHEYQAIDNIENQDPSDISTGSPTTSTLFDLLTQFITNLAYIPDYSDACKLILPFPEYAGGNLQVNPCTNKDKLGNDFIGVWTSLTLICFFVPVCWMLLRLIYGEIRSWTNG